MRATRTTGARDTVRYTEDEWLLQNLSYWLMAKVAPVIRVLHYATILKANQTKHTSCSSEPDVQNYRIRLPTDPSRHTYSARIEH
ncbi:hypothetical protein XNC1_0124 [Xenorhabdus nematophila ATCC 19061]|uniref:Uncharacterized protein n=2 Tax=Xenorhabdus nematophila TaxID=628 RepID=D3VGC2_XENNA|nr:hypothetical protein XNC1_0124 [Xenorhabdus nematophila ATCC 19061]CEK21130.1 hypothetical protein XNC2_0126 [Xenorhabdus nematophila AN6/1]